MLIYQSYFALRSSNRLYYFLILLLALISYAMARIYSIINDHYINNDNDIETKYRKYKIKWLSIYYHAGLHILANIAYLILYAGKIG